MEKLTLQKFVEKLSKSVDLTSFDLVKYYQHEKQQIVITIEVDFESCHVIWRLKSAKVQRNEDENQKVLSTSFHEKIAKFASEIAKCRQREVERFCQQLLRLVVWMKLKRRRRQKSFDKYWTIVEKLVKLHRENWNNLKNFLIISCWI